MLWSVFTFSLANHETLNPTQQKSCSSYLCGNGFFLVCWDWFWSSLQNFQKGNINAELLKFFVSFLGSLACFYYAPIWKKTTMLLIYDGFVIQFVKRIKVHVWLLFRYFRVDSCLCQNSRKNTRRPFRIDSILEHWRTNLF